MTGSGGSPTGRAQVLAVLTIVLAVVVGALALGGEESLRSSLRSVGPGIPEGEAAAPSVALLGDSIFSESADTLSDRLEPTYDVAIDAVPGLTTTQQIAGADRLAAEAAPVDQVVVNLGTNDAAQEVDPTESRRSLEQILATFPEARCVHLVTITDKARDLDPVVAWDEAVRVNEMLRTLAGDPRVRFVEWAAILDDNDPADGGGSNLGPLLRDRVHPTVAGQQALAEAVATSLDGC
ncbi:MAG: SGNH/GDSL hydrolase family protein [Acidimicrobiales bacterium]|nr:SGNH/GDSL hydrolase family protein [Acidimicrobiales bacterium]